MFVLLSVKRDRAEGGARLLFLRPVTHETQNKRTEHEGKTRQRFCDGSQNGAV